MLTLFHAACAATPLCAAVIIARSHLRWRRQHRRGWMRYDITQAERHLPPSHRSDLTYLDRRPGRRGR